MNYLDIVQGDLLEFDMLVTQGRKAFEPQEGDQYFFRVENGPDMMRASAPLRPIRIYPRGKPEQRGTGSHLHAASGCWSNPAGVWQQGKPGQCRCWMKN